MINIYKLKDFRKDILRAEIVGYMHNLGKLDPNFLDLQTYNSSEISTNHKIPPSDSSIRKQYTFKRFTRPSILKSDFPYDKAPGVLYFPDLSTRKRIEQIAHEISVIQDQLNLAASEDRKLLGIQLSELRKVNNKILGYRNDSEKGAWEQYEQHVEGLLFPDLGNWPLGSLLTMFWEKDWFDKPVIQKYKPGSNYDPDYQRSPKGGIKLKSGFSMDIPALLLLSHGEVSGQEKNGMDSSGNYIIDIIDNKSKNLASLRLSTPFGYELPLSWDCWQQKRKDIVDWVLANWNTPTQIILELKKQFKPLIYSLGDTQRPINEISLWIYSSSTSALFKTAIAEYFLTSQMPTPATMLWRLGSVRMDAFEFLFQSTTLSDLLGRQHLLTEVQTIIKHSLEVEIPIGSTVYCDEHGLVFVMPKFEGQNEKLIENELTVFLERILTNPENLETLKNRQQLYGIADIHPKFYLGSQQRGKTLNLRDMLPNKESVSIPNPKYIADCWINSNKERCTVCGLRPVGYLEACLPGFVTREKAEDRHICGICLARRGRRAQEWIKEALNETIWIDEVADVKGRVALITGKFDLSNWLDGTLIRTLAIGTDANGFLFAKAPTFARVQRTLEATRSFWQNICPTDDVGDKKETPTGKKRNLTDSVVGKVIGHVESRLEIRGSLQPRMKGQTIGDYHACELVLCKGVRMSVVWDPDNSRFITADNLDYLASEEQLGQSVEDALKVLAQNNAVLTIEESTGYSAKSKIWGTISFFQDGVKSLDISYTPAIPILAEPRNFMILVPANKALELVDAIKTKYEREMGKVRNRLPLHLGIVYGHKRTPLRAILDGGKRMLYQSNKPDGWRVTDDIRKKVEKNGHLPDRFNDDRSGHFHEWFEIPLEKDRRRLTWYIPAMMGDGQTLDKWYPFVFLECSCEPSDRDCRFKSLNPWTGSEGWLVHVAELKKDDMIFFTPATFDFQWLDSAGRRFEIAYDLQGQRLALSRRPYLLDELDSLNQIWGILKDHLSKNQIYNLRDIIEIKKEDWQVHAHDNVFRNFCHDALANAEWKNDKLPWEAEGKDRETWLAEWADYAAQGWLADVVELFLQTMKEDV